MLIIPAIDLYDGQCVRLYQGRKDMRTVFSANPLEVGLRWQEAGAKLLHVVDLNGAFEGQPANLPVVYQLAEKLSIPIQLGGGLRDAGLIRQIFDHGVSRIVLGTVAIKQPELFAQLCGQFPGRIVLGLDAKDGQVQIMGWTEGSGRLATQLAAEYAPLSPRAIVFTDTRRDGAMQGPNLESLAAMVAASPIPVIASGGISSLRDIEAIANQVPQVEGIITGMAIYTGAVDLAEAISKYQRG